MSRFFLEPHGWNRIIAELFRGERQFSPAQTSRERSRCLKRNRPRRNWRSNCGICRQKKMCKAVAPAISIALPFPFLHRASFLPREIASRKGIFSAERRATKALYRITATRRAVYPYRSGIYNWIGALLTASQTLATGGFLAQHLKDRGRTALIGETGQL